MLTKQIPIATAGGSIFPYSLDIIKKLKFVSKYEDPIELFKVIGEGANRCVMVPRSLAPIGKDDRRTKGIAINFNINFVPRSPEQSRIVNEATTLLKQGLSFLTEAPTGFGKTYVGSAIIGHVGRKTLIIIPKEDIFKQWRDALKSVLNIKDSDIGKIQGDICDVSGKKVVIAMVHSLCKDGRYPAWVYKEFGFVLADECHVLGADTFGQCMWLLPAELRMGLSATPYRKDGKDIVFNTHIGKVLVRSEAMPLLAKVIQVHTGWKVPRTKVNGVIIKRQFEAGRTMSANKLLAQSHVRNSMIADMLVSCYHKGRNPVFFSDLKEAHLEPIHDLLITRGIPAKDIGYYVGGIKEAEREYVKRQRIVLATYQMCSMATDAPWWDTAILGTPRADVAQIVGRVIREYEGKINWNEEGTKPGKCPIIMDLIDDDCNLFKQYADKRAFWYLSKKFKIIRAGD